MDLSNYEYLLFDADNTLLDFTASEDSALSSLFKELNIDLTDSLKEQYLTINHSLWASYERGEISRETVLDTRFSLLFKEAGINYDTTDIPKRYQTLLSEGHEIIPHAFKVLDTLKHTHKLYIVSNGVSTTQYRRLKESGLYPYFKAIFISEDTGYQKPQSEFFDYAAARIPDFAREKSLIIGDSLTSDIQGGLNYGIDTCWFNPHHYENKNNLKITFEIRSLLDLLP